MSWSFQFNDDANKDLIEYKIFNRWGEELFFTQNVDEGWDGRFKGVLQNNDVYVYKIRAL
ncbi:MAG: gliding motility-associated C-terminal domain-containing protein, partial [Flavobacteriales bacterium]|nr:gliding motility-associated C-terminal domain-containing protein [Flavobacteriales bacterium]